MKNIVKVLAATVATSFAAANAAWGQSPSTAEGQSPSNAGGQSLETASYVGNWKVPNWTTIVTEPGSIKEYIGRTWCGHCQGMCVSSNAVYFSFHDQIVKTDWYGHLLKRVEVDVHGGDICIWNGKLYTGVARRPKNKGEEWCPCIYVYDAETLERIKVKEIPSAGGCDGITVLDGVIYLAEGNSGKWNNETKSGQSCKYQKFDAETLEPLCDPIFVSHGDYSDCGSQNMTTDGKYIYSSHYTYDEAAKTPNVIIHDKDTFKVLGKFMCGRNNGLDFVPGGKDGAVRFAWVFTPNWTNRLQKPMPMVQGIVQFAEVKDGKVVDFTEYGGGYAKYLER